MNANDMTGFEEMAMTTLLGHRFGDRLVYLQGPDDRRLLKQAGRLGLVDEAGYLTSSGYQFWQRQGYRSCRRAHPLDPHRFIEHKGVKKMRLKTEVKLTQADHSA